MTQPTGEITIENNTFTNDMADHRTAFVNNDTATEAVLHGNKLHGSGGRPERRRQRQLTGLHPATGCLNARGQNLRANMPPPVDQPAVS